MKKNSKNRNRRGYGNLLVVFFCCMILSGCDRGQQSVLVTEETEKSTEIAETTETVSAEAASAEKEEKKICVYVCGAVQKPGVYEFSGGKRVWDAIQAAGGMKSNAAKESWNLAEPLKDGEQIRIPTGKEQRASGNGGGNLGHEASSGEGGSGQENASQESGSGASREAAAGMVNINTADVSELQKIPGVGATRAAAIVSYREEQGKFQKIEDIMKVTGIGEGIFSKMKGQITV